MLDPETLHGIQESLLRLLPHLEGFRQPFELTLRRASPAAAERLGLWVSANASLLQLALHTLDRDRLLEATIDEFCQSATGLLEPDDFAPIGGAILTACREVLAAGFTQASEEAWVNLCAHAADSLERNVQDAQNSRA